MLGRILTKQTAKTVKNLAHTSEQQGDLNRVIRASANIAGGASEIYCIADKAKNEFVKSFAKECVKRAAKETIKTITGEDEKYQL